MMLVQIFDQRFGTDFTDQDKLFIQQLEAKLDYNLSLESSVRVNDPENVRLTFNLVANELVQDMYKTNFKFYKQINDDNDFQKFFYSFLFDRYYRRAKGENK